MEGLRMNISEILDKSKDRFFWYPLLNLSRSIYPVRNNAPLLCSGVTF
jgi:hypothetical protein